MTAEEQQFVLKSLPKPDAKAYAQFHKEMRAKDEDMPVKFVDEYQNLTSMKALRGQSSGKQLPLRNMVARWLHAREEAIVAGVKVHSKVQLKDELPLAGVHR